MFHDLVAWFVAVFLLGPMQAELQGRLESARAPAAVVAQVSQCAAAAGPAIMTRATSDPWWAISTAFGTWIGVTSPEAALRDAAPGCAPALAAARPFLG